MKKLLQLRQDRAKAIGELEALIDDEVAFKAKEAEIEKLTGQIERLEKAEKLQQELAATQATGTGGTATTGTTTMSAPGNLDPGTTRFTLPAGVRRTSRLKHFKGQDADCRAYRFGQFALATLWGRQKAHDWLKDNGVILTRAQSEGVDTAGGFMVPEEFSFDIIDLRDQYGMFRRLCQVMPMGRDTMTVPRRKSGLTAYAVGEGVGITQSQAAWNQVRLTAQKWGVLTLMSSELDEDAVIAIGDLLVGEMAYAFAVAEDTAGFSGDGSATYHGIRGLIPRFEGAGLAGGVAAATGHDLFSEIDATDLATLMGKLPQYVYQTGSPAFYCSQVAWATVFQRIIMNSGGISKDDATGRVIYSYLGFPVEISPSMPTATTTLVNKIMLFFGDVGMAVAFGDRRGMTVARSTEYKFAEDQIAIKATERFDINVHDIGDTTAAGPLVGLIGA